MAQLQYKINAWTRKIWLSDTLYYHAEIKQDLFGSWILERHWCGRWQKSGRVVIDLLDSFDDGLLKLQEIHQKRIAHGYQLIEEEHE